MPGKRKSSSRRPAAARPAPLADALLARALAAQGEGVLIGRLPATEAGCQIVYVNARMAEISGYPAAELLGERHGVLHTEREEMERFRRWAEAATPGGEHSGEGDLVRKNGEAFFAAWNFSVVQAPGAGRFVVATYRDTTEKRHLLEALMHAQRLDAVGRLAGGVAHDFNNLISVINGYCQLLATRPGVSGDVLRDVEEIHKAGQKAAALTRQLLTFGRRQPMSLRLLALNQLLRDNEDILRRLLDGRGDLVVEPCPQPVWVRGDADQLQQVLLNLTLNARDALRDRGRVTWRTELRQVESRKTTETGGVPPGKYAVLVVHDNGTGMDAYTQAHLFEPFYTTKESGRGSGLGLATVYGVMQQSGGYIRVQSTLLVGTTFELYLPAVPPDEVPASALAATATAKGEAASPEASAAGSALSGRGGSPAVVLLLEQDRMVGKMAAGMLAADGYRVLAAETPKQALTLLRQHAGPVHLFISGCAVAADGEKILARLQSQPQPVRILCTRTGGEPLPALAGGCLVRRLPKPYAMSELLEAVRQLLQAPLSSS